MDWIFVFHYISSFFEDIEREDGTILYDKPIYKKEPKTIIYNKIPDDNGWGWYV